MVIMAFSHWCIVVMSFSQWHIVHVIPLIGVVLVWSISVVHCHYDSYDKWMAIMKLSHLCAVSLHHSFVHCHYYFSTWCIANTKFSQLCNAIIKVCHWCMVHMISSQCCIGIIEFSNWCVASMSFSHLSSATTRSCHWCMVIMIFSQWCLVFRIYRRRVLSLWLLHWCISLVYCRHAII